MKEFARKEYVRLTSQQRFHVVQLAIVETHVPLLKASDAPITDVERGQLLRSVSVMEETDTLSTRRKSTYECPLESIVEMRQLFLELLSDAYETMVRKGELDNKERGGYDADVLKQSVAFALSNVKEAPLSDWDHANMVPFYRDAKDFIRGHRRGSSRAGSDIRGHRRGNSRAGSDWTWNLQPYGNYLEMKLLVVRAICFIEGHRVAAEKLQVYVNRAAPELRECGSWKFLRRAVETVLEESKKQVVKAQEAIKDVSEEDVVKILSHYVSTIILHRLTGYIERNAADEVLSSEEARTYLEEIDREIEQVRACCDEACCASDVHDGGSAHSHASIEDSKNEATELGDLETVEIGERISDGRRAVEDTVVATAYEGVLAMETQANKSV